MKTLIVAMALFLGACSMEHRAALKYANDNVKAANDTQATLLKQAPCAIDVGAYWRALNNAERNAVDILCGK